MIAAETRAILDINHDFMLKQMQGSTSQLDMARLTRKVSSALPPAPPSAAPATPAPTGT